MKRDVSLMSKPWERDFDAPPLRRRLMTWYARHRRQLPWRDSRDPYAIWVSEVMLQQTQVNTVRPYYAKFLHAFPRPADLARADTQAVLKVWEGLGYYARARNLHEAAKLVTEKYGGKVPDNWEEFRKLPGVGEYIASAVLSIAFGRAHAVVDGNVKRVLARLFLIDDPVNEGRSQKVFKAAATALLDNTAPGRFNEAMMELGALVCRPRGPVCPRCCLAAFCAARRLLRVDQYPKRGARKSVPTHHIATGVLRKRGKLLITQRKSQGLLGGLWEFPGGKVKSGEGAERACLREIHEETGIVAEIDRHLTRVKHAYTHFKIEMDVFSCRFVSGRVRLNGPQAFRWIRPNQIREFPLPKANLKFISLLENEAETAIPKRHLE